MLRIRPLEFWQVPRFIALRRRIEQEAKYLSVSGNERTDSLWKTLAKMFINRRRVCTLVAYDDKEMVGYAWMVLARFQKFRGNAYIATVSVLAERRGQGIGTRLMDALERCARGRKMRRLELEVFAGNTRAVALYERLGYELEGRKRRAVRNGDEVDDILIMAKLLE